jgi:3',5'-cyclic AMP phosphodiesterase CpdA
MPINVGLVRRASPLHDDRMVTRSLYPQCGGRVGGSLALVCSFLVFSVAASAQDVARTFRKGPYLQSPGSDTMTIMWESPTNRPGVVHYGRKGKLDEERRLERPRELIGVSSYTLTNATAESQAQVTQIFITNRVFLYAITLTNLQPKSVYTYLAETDGVRTSPRKFRTFGARQSKVTFIAYGDSRTNPHIHESLASNFDRHSPDFILHTGDLAADGRRYNLWGREFFGPLAQVIDEVPILPSIGNHEQDASNYLHYVHLPGNERWYSYRVGPVHVLALDFHYEKETEEQFAFARKDLLASEAPWKVVFLHYPVFNIGGHGTGWGHAAYLPLFHETKVDLVMAGHSHIYERFRPVASRGETDDWPIMHITTGGGGAPLYASYAHPALSAQATTNHFVLIEATPTKLTGRTFSTNNTLIDKFEWKKRNGRPEADYLAATYPEELLKLSLVVGRSLAGGLTSVPTTNSAARVLFNFPATNATPVALEINLTPSSAPHYEIEGGPLRITTPSTTNAAAFAWARIRSTGKQKIESTGQNRVLSPPLVFQARIVAGNAETFAFGQRCRISDAAVEAAKKLAETR